MINSTSYHDAIFKTFMGDISIAQDFFRSHLPPAVCRICDFSTLKICPTHFLERDMRGLTCDILYSLDTSKGNGYIYCVIEHQSKPDKLMAYRLLRYSLAAMKMHLDQGFKKLPVVFPCLFYQGAKPYPYSTDWLDCFADVELARKVYSEPFQLIDIAAIPDHEIVKHRRVALLELVQKHIRQRDISTQVKLISDLMMQWPLSIELRKTLLYYIAKTGDKGDIKQLFVKLAQRNPDYQEEIMTYAQELEAIGLEKGREQGLEQGRLDALYQVTEKLIQSGVDSLLIKKYTGLTDEQLAQLLH